MIDKSIKEALWDNVESMIIDADNVANVVTTNSLNHGLLVLTQMKYSVIPVLTPKSKLAGLVGMPMIINALMTDESFLSDKLDTMQISEVMLKDPVTITLETDLEDIMRLLIDNNFLCVVNPEDNHFIGIVTRRALIQRFNYLAHNFSADKDIKRVLDFISVLTNNELAYKRAYNS